MPDFDPMLGNQRPEDFDQSYGPLGRSDISFGDIPIWKDAELPPDVSDPMPRFGGRVPEGGSVELYVHKAGDYGNVTTVPVNYYGDGSVWEAALPEMENGDYVWGYKSTDAAGEETYSGSFEITINADAETRAQAAERNQRWRESGAAEWAQGQLDHYEEPLKPVMGVGPNAQGGGTGAPAATPFVPGEPADATSASPDASGTSESEWGPGEVGQPLPPDVAQAFEDIDKLEEEERQRESAGSGISGGGSGEAPLTASPVVPVPQGSGAPPPPAGGQGGGAGGGGPGGQSGQGGGQGEQAPAAQQGEPTEPPRPRTGDAPPQPPAILGLEKGNAGFINA